MAPFCEHCIDLKEIPGDPTGTFKEIGNVRCYVTTAAAVETKPGSIIVSTDIFALAIPNSKLIADSLSQRTGRQVIVPDIFEGDPIIPSSFPFPKHARATPLSEEQINANANVFMNWMGKGHGVDDTWRLTEKVIDKLAGPVGIVGFCYGAKLAALASETKNEKVKAVVLYHPTFLQSEDAEKIATPTLLSLAEVDPSFTREMGDDWFKILKAKDFLDSRSKVYDGTFHGFGSRPDLSNAEIQEAYQQSHQAMAEFFEHWLII